MSDLFQRIEGEVTEEQVAEIVKTGVVPSHLKSVDDKVYFIIMRNFMVVMYSNIAGYDSDQPMEIDGEAFIVTGRHNAFVTIKEYLEEDAEQSTDLRTSIVMVEGVDAAKGVSLYRFIQLCNQAYPDEAIDESILERMLNGISEWKEESKRPNTVNNSGTTTGFGGNAGTLTNEEE